MPLTGPATANLPPPAARTLCAATRVGSTRVGWLVLRLSSDRALLAGACYAEIVPPS